MLTRWNLRQRLNHIFSPIYPGVGVGVKVQLQVCIFFLKVTNRKVLSL